MQKAVSSILHFFVAQCIMIHQISNELFANLDFLDSIICKVEMHIHIKSMNILLPRSLQVVSHSIVAVSLCIFEIREFIVIIEYISENLARYVLLTSV